VDIDPQDPFEYACTYVAETMCRREKTGDTASCRMPITSAFAVQ
jgi:hypothetical protein